MSIDLERAAIAAAARLEQEKSQLNTQLAACSEAYDVIRTAVQRYVVAVGRAGRDNAGEPEFAASDKAFADLLDLLRDEL